MMAVNEKNGDPPQSPKLKIEVMSNDAHIHVGQMHQQNYFKSYVTLYI